MSRRPNDVVNPQLDKRLAALFGGLDTSPGFDARLMPRLREETQIAAIERAAQARQEEQERYSHAIADAQRRRRRAFRLVVLDAVGVAALASAAVAMTWQHVGSYLAAAAAEYASDSLAVTGLTTAGGLLLTAIAALAAWRLHKTDSLDGDRA
jgi:hypothetical protein